MSPIVVAALVILAGLLFSKRQLILDTCSILFHYRQRLDFITRKLQSNNNKTVKFNLLGVSTPAYIFDDPANVESALKTNFPSFVKGVPFYQRFQELLGRGIFNTDGTEWKLQRKLASHMFSARLLRENMAPVFVQHNTYLLSRVERLRADTQYFDLQDVFYRFTMDSIGEIAFGVNINSLNKDHVPFARAFDICQAYCQDRFFTPFWRLERDFGKLPLIGGLFCGARARRIQRELDILNKFAYDVIALRRSDPDLASRTDVLSRMMTLDTSDMPDVKAIDDAFLRDLLQNFIIAGRDTTATAMAWTVYHISSSPEVQEKVLKELDTVLQGKTPDFESVKSLPYLLACFQESLRLYPSVPVDVKQAVRDTKLADGTLVPKGKYIMYAIYSMGRNTDIWGPDAATFRPERWIEMQSNPTPYAYPVFNAGPRTCLGQPMALLEARLVLACLYQKYTFELQPGKKFTYTITVTCPVDGGLQVRPIPRS